jgi:PAS domain S-box-containing protein
MLGYPGAGAKTSRSELTIVHRNAMRLSKLVNALLDFSRIEAGRVQASYEPTDLGAHTREVASAFDSALQHAGLEFVVDCLSLPEPAYVDRDMWEKIVLNLISNAFKFTLSGRVTVRLIRAADHFELSVSDTGTGIPADQVAHVFNRFHRVEGVTGRTGEGSGIGLALVQELAKLHGGSVRVESSLGQGSTFYVTIPAGQGHLPLDRVGRTRIVGSSGAAAAAYVDEALQWLPEVSRPAEPRQVFAADTVHAPHAESATARIVLADDNADMRAYVQRLLGDSYAIRAFASGADALDAVRRDPPDLVLTDVMMPGVDGFEFVRQLRADPATSTIPIILLSARAGEDARVEGLGSGADDYIVKPFTARELLARVGAHLSMSKLRQEAGERERTLRAEAEAAHLRLATILESISDAFIALDPEWRFTYVNAEAERSMGMSRADLTGRVFWDVFPETRSTEVYAHFVRAMTERVPVRFESFYPPWRRWFENRVYPAKDGGLSVFYQDITDRKQTEAAIRKTNDALRRANADLEQFAYSASHDLREPLRTVRVYCELLRRDYARALDADAGEMIGECVAGVQRMDALLTDLLEYVRASISTGVDEPGEPMSLESALAGALGNLQTTIEGTGATVTHDPLPSVRVAAVHAQQLFQNLIGNSLKYRSEAAPRVHVGARLDGDAWIISVQDNGIGIAPEHQERVFGVFKRLHSAYEYSGSGVGLAICKKVVERYGGNIWVESEVGKGSCFYFSLPEDAGRARISSA